MSSSTVPTTSIEDLPPEMISELFKHLSPRDLAVCSVVNKRWNSIYSNFKLHKLVAMSYRHDVNEIFEWYGSKQIMREAEQCCSPMFGRLVEKPLLSSLKHLALAEFGFDPNRLNRFQQLAHLEINFNCFFNQKNLHLNLPRLKVLVFHESNYHCALSIDCPLLSTLAYNEKGFIVKDALLKVKHPETIRKLETNLIGEKLTPFKSVECLATQEYQTINEAILLSLPRLRELRYNGNIESVVHCEFGSELGTIDHVKRTLNEFLDEAKKLRGSDFRFTFAGFELTKVDVEQIDFGVQIENGEETVCNEYVYMKNYHLIESGALHFVDRVNYTDLSSHVTGEFPRCFTQKFTHVKYVSATAKVQDTDHFLWFLKSLRFLKSLSLDPELGQEFYDQLPALVPSLESLTLKLGHYEDELQLNFDFISKLFRLSSLHIYPALSSKSLHSLVRWLGKFVECVFYVKSNREFFNIRKEMHEWKIWKDPSKFSILLLDDKLVFKTENPEEIVHFFEGLPNKTSEGEGKRKGKKKRSKRS